MLFQANERSHNFRIGVTQIWAGGPATKINYARTALRHWFLIYFWSTQWTNLIRLCSQNIWHLYLVGNWLKVVLSSNQPCECVNLFKIMYGSVCVCVFVFAEKDKHKPNVFRSPFAAFLAKWTIRDRHISTNPFLDCIRITPRLVRPIIHRRRYAVSHLLWVCKSRAIVLCDCAKISL